MQRVLNSDDFYRSWDSNISHAEGDELSDHAQAIIVIIIDNSSKTVNQSFVR